MTCDVKINKNDYCQNEVEFYGRWIGYCKKHQTIGKQIDLDHTFDNEVQPDIESGNFDYIQAHGLEDVLLEKLG
jgi:hypothetical protein